MYKPTQAPGDDPGDPVISLEPSKWLTRRTSVGLFLLVFVTVVALAAAWCWPDRTSLHFWLVAQALPVFYALLAWWWARQPAEFSYES